jgi:hypothetical protein
VWSKARSVCRSPSNRCLSPPNGKSGTHIPIKWYSEIGHARPLGCTPNGLQHDTRPKDRKTASQRQDRFWTSNCLDDSYRLLMNLGLKPMPLEESWKYLSIHIKNVQIWLSMRPGHPF